MEDLNCHTTSQVMSTSASSSKKKIQPGLGFTATAAGTPGDGGSSSGGASISGTGSNPSSAGKRPVPAESQVPDRASPCGGRSSSSSSGEASNSGSGSKRPVPEEPVTGFRQAVGVAAVRRLAQTNTTGRSSESRA
jgi:hypothetical protein